VVSLLECLGLFEFYARLGNGQPLRRLRRIRSLESHFDKSLAEAPIIVGPHCRIPKPHARLASFDGAVRK
jgi:hypothetical protein